MRYPKVTDEAQYSLPFPVAAALVHGQLFYDELSGDNLNHPEVLRLSSLVELIEDDYFNERFPAQRLSRVVIETSDGTKVDSGVVKPLWDLTAEASDKELLEKFRTLSQRYLSPTRASALEDAIWHIEDIANVSELLALLAPQGK